MQVTKHTSEGSTLTLKHRTDITRQKGLKNVLHFLKRHKLYEDHSLIFLETLIILSYQTAHGRVDVDEYSRIFKFGKNITGTWKS